VLYIELFYSECNVLLFCVKTPSPPEEEGSKKRRKTFRPSGDFLLWYFCNAFIAPVGVLFVKKALGNEWYIVVNAYKFTTLEI